MEPPGDEGIAMQFSINYDLLTKARMALAGRDKLYWLVGGAGSGKTTICQALAAKYDMPIYDMDAQIYGAYHGRFNPTKHPANTAWAASSNGLAWLLDMTWPEFNSFNQAALPEYLNLLVEDLATTASNDSLLVDGGICNPSLLSQAIPACQIVCLAGPEQSTQEIWEGSEARLGMKEFVYQLPQPEEAWQKFLYFDEQITATIIKESQEGGISVCARNGGEAVQEFAERVAYVLGIG